MKNVVSNKNKLAYCKWHSVEVKKEAATKKLDNCITHSLYKQPLSIELNADQII